MWCATTFFPSRGFAKHPNTGNVQNHLVVVAVMVVVAVRKHPSTGNVQNDLVVVAVMVVVAVSPLE